MRENVVIKPHRNYLAKLYISTLLVFLVFIFPFVCLGLVPELGWVYIFIFLTANALWLIPTFLLIPAYYRSISYELREDEIVVRKGILTKSTKVVPYRTVTNLHLKRGPLDRWLFNLGTLAVETAGQSGQTSAEATLVGLDNYEQVQAMVREELRRYRRSMATMTETEEPMTGDTAQMLAELLAEVREIKGIINRK